MRTNEGIIIVIICSVFSSISLAADLSNNNSEKSGISIFEKYYEPYVITTEPNAPGYTLPLNVKDISNFKQVNLKIKITSKIQELIQKNGFAVLETQNDDLEHAYLSLLDTDVPYFITTDTFLHLYHVQFDTILKELESEGLKTDLKDMIAALLEYNLSLYGNLEGNFKEAARRNIAYLSVAEKLIDPESNIPGIVSDIVTSELDKIEAHAGIAQSDIFKYSEDYTQYIPRGHYSDTKVLQGYFKTMMWLGRMKFYLNESNRIQTLQAFLLAASLDKAVTPQRKVSDIWDKLYKVTAFFVGTADDLTPYDYLATMKKVLGPNYKLSDLANNENFEMLTNELRQLHKPEILSNISDPLSSLDENLENSRGMCLMGQRMIPDSRIFQNLVFPNIGRYTGSSKNAFTLSGQSMRGYPRGLDVMALMGSAVAKQILTKEGDASYNNYSEKFDQLKKDYDELSLLEWNQNIYWSWLFTIKSLLTDLPDGYPNFMKSAAWQKHQLNTALASWTELKHDTILYSKQSYVTAGLYIKEELSPPPAGYVEPNLIFYTRLLSLTRMTSKGLADMNAISQKAAKRLNELEKILEQMIEIVKKELSNQNLTEDENEYIRNFASEITKTTSGMVVSDKSTRKVIDVFTNATEGLVLEEGTGDLDSIIVACPSPDGSIFLAVGPTLSYYEFKQPLANRLTDMQWLGTLHQASRKPKRQSWYITLMK